MAREPVTYEDSVLQYDRTLTKLRAMLIRSFREAQRLGYVSRTTQRSINLTLRELETAYELRESLRQEFFNDKFVAYGELHHTTTKG